MPQRGADGPTDGASHAAREGVGVGGDLVDDRLDDLVGGGPQRGPECGDRRPVQGRFADPPHGMAHDCMAHVLVPCLFPANNWTGQIYILWSGLYALRRSKLES